MGEKVDMEVLRRVKEVIRDIVCPDQNKWGAITPETKISELAPSDFELCLLLEQVEDSYGIEIPEETILTVGDLCSYVQKNIGELTNPVFI